MAQTTNNRIAEATGTHSSVAPTRELVLDLPEVGQVQSVAVKPGQGFEIAFDLTAARVSLQADALILAFEDGRAIQLEGFVSAAQSGAPPYFVLQNSIIILGNDIVGRIEAMPGQDPIQTMADLMEIPGSGTSAVFDDFGRPITLLRSSELPEGTSLQPSSPPFTNFDREFLQTDRDEGGLNLAQLVEEDEVGILPPLFDEQDNIVDFNGVSVGTYADGTQYDALQGADSVVLPTDSLQASEAGYDTSRAMDAGAGNDTVQGGTLDDTIRGGAGDDVLLGGDGADTLDGGSGNDTLYGGADNDELYGGIGVDTISGDAGADVIDGGADNDTINLANGDFAAGESLTGGGGTDNITLTNATTVDLTTGTLATIETINGSTGNDTVTISGTQLNSFTSLNFNGGTDTLNINATSTGLNTMGATDASITGLETISFSTAAAAVTLSLTAQTEAFTITGSGNDDTITGGAGADTINTGAGEDTVVGGGGNDAITANTSVDAAISTILSGNAEAILGTDGTIMHVFTTAGTDTLTLTAGITSIDVVAWGGGAGGGGGGDNNAGGAGGGSGFVEGTITVADGATIAVAIGGGGGEGNTTGGGGNAEGTGGGGGGYSGVFDTSISQANALFLSGGGGGGGGGDNTGGAPDGGAGGASGGSSGSAGSGGGGNVGAGGGGTQVAGGAAGTGNTAQTVSGGVGAALAGGDGGDTINAAAIAGGTAGINGGGEGGLASTTMGRAGGGAGGAGYYGGGGGTASNAANTSGAGGGGGSNFIDGTATSTTNTAATGSTPSQTDPFYLAGIGVGGAGGAADTNGVAGGDGLVVLSYLMSIQDVSTIAGGTGNDTLTGGSGMDIFEFRNTGAANTDTITNFNRQIDKLDLADLLTGYDPLTELISDFVEITDSGANSVVRVDIGGTASFGAGTEVATINGVTGLTDEAFLETFGVLIIA